jgi:hypothetical protein
MNGIAVLRRAMRKWGTKTNTAPMAQDLGMASTVLDDFAAGKGNLTPDLLNKLTRHIFAGAMEYDAPTDTLVSTNKTEPAPMNAAPLPGEPPEKPRLSKDARRMPVGQKVVKKAQWNPQLDKNFRPRAESKGPLG